MIQYTLIPLRNQTHNCQAIGWGKSLMKPCKSDAEIINWKQLAAKRIVFEKMQGFVANRAIAYQMAGYTDKWKLDNLKFLQFYMPTLEGKPAIKVWEFVVKHSGKFTSLLPFKPNKQTIEVTEIINYCKFNLTNYEQKT